MTLVEEFGRGYRKSVDVIEKSYITNRFIRMFLYSPEIRNGPALGAEIP